MSCQAEDEVVDGDKNISIIGCKRNILYASPTIGI